MSNFGSVNREEKRNQITIVQRNEIYLLCNRNQQRRIPAQQARIHTNTHTQENIKHLVVFEMPLPLIRCIGGNAHPKSITNIRIICRIDFFVGFFPVQMLFNTHMCALPCHLFPSKEKQTPLMQPFGKKGVFPGKRNCFLKSRQRKRRSTVIVYLLILLHFKNTILYAHYFLCRFVRHEFPICIEVIWLISIMHNGHVLRFRKRNHRHL